MMHAKKAESMRDALTGMLVSGKAGGREALQRPHKATRRSWQK